VLPDEELEIVDFTDFGKFVGVEDNLEEPIAETLATPATSRPRRAVASDFLDDASPGNENAPAPTDVGSWRRKSSLAPAESLPPSTPVEPQTQSASSSSNLDKSAEPADGVVLSGKGEESTVSRQSTLSSFSNADATASADHPRQGLNQRGFSNQGHPRPPRAPYKEPAMSALDDAMSRIKGVIDGMQSGEIPPGRRPSVSGESDRLSTKQPFPAPSVRPPPAVDSRWVPPPFRTTRQQGLDVPPVEEVSAVSSCEPPQSPTPSLDSIRVRLPSVSVAHEPLNRRQIQQWKTPTYLRWDILSWDPPVEYMNRRTLSINDILFRKPFDKGKGVRYRVALPRGAPRTNTHRSGSDSPRVNLPANSGNKFSGAFGKSSGSDTLSTWRKPALSPKMESEVAVPDSALRTMSRSPPPESPTTASGDKSMVKTDTAAISIQRMRSPPKMPEGSGVAFYRGSRVDSASSDSQTMVNFIVGSELDETPDGPIKGDASKPQILVSAPATTVPSHPVTETKPDARVSHASIVNDLKSQPPSPDSIVPSLVHSAIESKCSDDSVCLRYRSSPLPSLISLFLRLIVPLPPHRPYPKPPGPSLH
jgi:serine/arginine repetitive matrix protein 2